jgi:hypothetical protein
MNNINHLFSWFYVEYGYSTINNWTEGKLIFIHSVPYLLYVIAGIYLPHYFRYSSAMVQLIINWISFHLLLYVMAGLVSGLFIYYGPGVAITWFFVNMPVRIAGVIIMLILIFMSVGRFAWYFMFSIPETIDISDHHQSQFLIKQFVMVPFIITFAMIAPLTDMFTLLNFALSFLLGVVFIFLIYQMVPGVYLHRGCVDGNGYK